MTRPLSERVHTSGCRCHKFVCGRPKWPHDNCPVECLCVYFGCGFPQDVHPITDIGCTALQSEVSALEKRAEKAEAIVKRLNAEDRAYHERFWSEP